MFTLKNQFQITYARGGGGEGGVKSVSRSDCELQGEKLLRLLSQLRPRIRALYYICFVADNGDECEDPAHLQVLLPAPSAPGFCHHRYQVPSLQER